MAADVADAAGVDVGVAVLVGVAVCAGVLVNVALGVFMGFGVLVAVGLGVGVAVGAGVSVGRGVGDGIAAGVGAGVAVGSDCVQPTTRNIDITMIKTRDMKASPAVRCRLNLNHQAGRHTPQRGDTQGVPTPKAANALARRICVS